MIDKKRWPAWCLGPDGESKLFDSPDEMPVGFYHPRLGKPEKTAPTKKPSIKPDLDL